MNTATKMPQDQRVKQEEALRRFLNLCRSTNLSYSINPWGEGVVFEESGRARLTNIAGFLKGLTVMADMGPLDALAATASKKTSPMDLALKLSLDLDGQLQRLSTYGGQREIVVEEATETREQTVIKVPAYKVLLCDDSTFGGFSVLWHRPFTIEQVQAKAREHDEASYQGRESDGTPLSDEDSRRRWDSALAQARNDLGIRKELETFRSWTPHGVRKERVKAEALHEEHKTDDDSLAIYGCDHEDCQWSRDRLKFSSRQEYIEYGFAFNGGLLLHGMGHNTFAVEISGDSGPHWSIHT